MFGLGAILMWGFLAVLSAPNLEPGRTVPPFLLSALAFTLASVIGFLLFPRRKKEEPPVPRGALLLGFFGIFGFHFFYFVALSSAPKAQAVLISYLWPLLLVVFTGFLPGMPLSVRHVTGSVIGFAGAVVVITGGKQLDIDPAYVPGYLAALASAVIWALYSVGSRRYGQVGTRAVVYSCALSAAGAWICHFLFETTIWPSCWWCVIGLGVGPLGLAFYCWDYGMKRGDIRLLGTLSYLDPILTIALLVVFKMAEPTPALWIACALIVSGALVAALPKRGQESGSSGFAAPP